MIATISRKRRNIPDHLLLSSWFWRGRCKCGECGPDGEPYPHVYIGSAGISYDCWCEGNEPPPNQDRKITAGEALEAGLTIRRSRRKPRPVLVLVAGCEAIVNGEVCGGLRPRGDRYCHRCAAILLQQIREQQKM